MLRCTPDCTYCSEQEHGEEFPPPPLVILYIVDVYIWRKDLLKEWKASNLFAKLSCQRLSAVVQFLANDALT